MPDVQPAGDEEEIAAAVPVYGGEFDSITVDVDDIAAMGVERGVDFGAHYWFWMLLVRESMSEVEEMVGLEGAARYLPSVRNES